MHFTHQIPLSFTISFDVHPNDLRTDAPLNPSLYCRKTSSFLLQPPPIRNRHKDVPPSALWAFIFPFIEFQESPLYKRFPKRMSDKNRALVRHQQSSILRTLTDVAFFNFYYFFFPFSFNL